LLSAFASEEGNLALQFMGDVAKKSGITDKKIASGINRVSSLKIWGGSNPLSLTLKIPVLDDGHTSAPETQDGLQTNLVEALEILGSLCLPKYTKSSVLGYYTPPPSPLNVNAVWTKTGEKENSTTFGPSFARIMLQLGGILLLDHCIVDKIDVRYPNTKAMIKHDYTAGQYLHPLLAEVTITISTVEAMTINAYSDMLWLHPDSSKSDKPAAGALSSDVSSVVNNISTAYDKFMSTFTFTPSNP
jgi:hypothetical protein